MRIIPKLTLALFASTCVVLGVNGTLRVRRELRYFESERVRQHDRTARSLAAALTATWRADGRESALAALDASRRHLEPDGLRLKWSEAEGAAVPEPCRDLERGSAGEPTTSILRGRSDTTWSTCVGIDVLGSRRGFLELTETMTLEESFVGTVLFDTVKTALALALLSTLISYAMSQWLLGRPVRALSEKARRIGQGDFESPVVLRQRDELADLAREMNVMGRRLATTIEQLRHADRLATVGKLASGVAHELGTPLNVITARASMIRGRATSLDECRGYAAVVMEASNRMTKIIQQLLRFARRRGLEKTSADIALIARDTVELLRPLARKRGVELTVAHNEAAHAEVDAAQVQQVVTNLVVNAIQAVSDGGRVDIRIDRRRARASDETPDYVRIVVSDDGAGIDDDDLPQVFEPFFTTKDVGEGTGLGLAVTYGIVRDHGGVIDVTSTKGAGTTFTVLLPRGAAAWPA